MIQWQVMNNCRVSRWGFVVQEVVRQIDSRSKYWSCG